MIAAWKRHDRFARSHVALQQTPHGLGICMSPAISFSTRFCAAVG
jgi:hypothetical protein